MNEKMWWREQTYAGCNIWCTSIETSADRIYQLEQCGDGITSGENASIYQFLSKRNCRMKTHETICKESSNYSIVEEFFWVITILRDGSIKCYLIGKCRTNSRSLRQQFSRWTNEWNNKHVSHMFYAVAMECLKIVMNRVA